MNIKQILEDGVAGDIAELGVYQGNSAALLAHYAREYKRTVLLFDTFKGFDGRDLVGVDKSKSIEFTDTSLEEVRGVVGKERVRFVQGRFPQSIPPDVHGSRFCLVHIDCDLYEPAKAGLEFFYPRLSPGGLIILHDYNNPHWGGIKRAVDEYCRRIPERPVVIGDKSGTAMLRKHDGTGFRK
jgi:SAM-dependent methyltransferase